jgi:hypothetical protein
VLTSRRGACTSRRGPTSRLDEYKYEYTTREY